MNDVTTLNFRNRREDGAPPSAFSNVGRILKKDLRQHWLLVPMVLVFEIVSFEILRAQTGTRATPILVQLLGWIAAFVFCFRSAVAEEKARAFRFLMALPMTAGELIGAKYVLNGVLVVVNFGLLLLYLLGSGELLGRGWPGSLSFPVVALLLSTQLLASFTFLAIALLLDSEKAIWVPFPLIWVAASLSASIPRFARAAGIDWRTAGPTLLVWAVLASVTAAGFLAVTVPLIARRRRWSC
jgi:hypothetical protein